MQQLSNALKWDARIFTQNIGHLTLSPYKSSSRKLSESGV